MGRDLVSGYSLDEVIGWGGAVLLMAVFVPMGLLLGYVVGSAGEMQLAARGEELARSIATQVAEPLIVSDRLVLARTLREMAFVENDVLYARVVGKGGKVVAWASRGIVPLQGQRLWRSGGKDIVHFRSGLGPCLETRAPIFGGKLGYVYLGFRRSRAVANATRALTVLSACLALGLAALFLLARRVADQVSAPLLRLEARAVQLPGRGPSQMRFTDLSGTREVNRLVAAFEEMRRRLVELEREGRVAQQAVIHAERLATLGKLSAGLAHEIQNPLDGTLECVRYLLTDPKQSSRATKYLPMVMEGLERIARVMREMLVFARSGRGIAIEVVPVTELLESIRPFLSIKLKRKDITLESQLKAACVALCDPQGVEQALINVVLNGIQALDGVARPTISLSARCDADSIAIFVDDNGPGVAEALRERIFDPFFTSRPPGQGTGLGLSVSRQLLRSAGGDVKLARKASPLGGARFIIQLAKARHEECEYGRRQSG